MRLALSLGTVVVFLGLLEIALRLAGYGPGEDRLQWIGHPDLQYLPAPDQDTFFGKDDAKTGETLLPIHINAYGQRGEDYPLTKPPGELRIIGLGDSLMFGPGVLDSQTFLAVLQQRLLAQPLATRSVRVINAAVNGWATIHYLRWVETQLERFDPDLLVLGLFIGNDMVIPTRGAIDVPVPMENLLRRSAIGRFVHQTVRDRVWERTLEQRGERPLEEVDDELAVYAGIIESKLSFQDKIRLWDHALPHLERMHELAGAAGVPMLCVLIPTSWMTRKTEDVPIHPWLARRIEATGIELIALLDDLRPVAGEAWLSFDEGHFSPAGHRAVAEALHRGLIRLGRLP